MSPPAPSSAAALDPSEAAPVTPVGIECIYRNEQHALVRFITRYRASPDDAQDVAQEAFVRLAQSEKTRDRAIERPGAFLRQIARNLLRDRAKAAARRSEALHIPFDDEAISDANELARLEARDGLDRVEAVLRRMKPRTREIFMANRLDGLSYAEIADRTGLTVSGVEKQMRKAMTLLLRHAGRD